MDNTTKITKQEIQSILILSIIFSLRMLGIFMILPILTVYAISLIGANEHLIGISIGIYGIMQIIFQLPYGVLSDQFGRKFIIIIGLIISGIGSEIAAISNEIWGLIVGRALQGSGAIGSVLIALLLDSVREQYKTQATATIGISFGITFTISMILGPFIASKFELNGLFHFITILTGLAILLVIFSVPTISYPYLNKKNNLIEIVNDIKSIIIHKRLFKCNFHIFCLHTVLILNFIVWPKIIMNLGYNRDMHFKIYAIIVLVSILIMTLCLFYLKTKNRRKKILNISTNILFLSELIMFFTGNNNWIFLFGMQLFFIAFNLIESILPSLISAESPIQYKGTTISIYSIAQFIGVGLGGTLGGYLLETQGIKSIFSCALIIILSNIIINNTLYQNNLIQKFFKKK